MAIVGPRIFRGVVIPISIIFVLSLVLSLAAWWRVRGQASEMPEQQNPTMLRAALVFGAMYAVVLLAVAWVKDAAGNAGLYAVAAVAGLTDVDAITLSAARMGQLGEIDADRAWRVIVIAFLSNLAFKAGIVAVAGSRRLLAIVAGLFAVLGAGSGLVMLFYR